MATKKMMTMVVGVWEPKIAKRSDEIIPLPYWSEPRRAAADPVNSSGTAARAAALEQAATIPFIEKVRNIGTAIPQIPQVPESPRKSKRQEKAKAILVDTFKRIESLNLETN